MEHETKLVHEEIKKMTTRVRSSIEERDFPLAKTTYKHTHFDFFTSSASQLKMTPNNDPFKKKGKKNFHLNRLFCCFGDDVNINYIITEDGK